MFFKVWDFLLEFFKTMSFVFGIACCAAPFIVSWVLLFVANPVHPVFILIVASPIIGTIARIISMKPIVNLEDEIACSWGACIPFAGHLCVARYVFEVVEGFRPENNN